MENTSPTKWKRRSLQEITDIISEFEQSGLSQKSFCTRKGICTATLANWRRKLRKLPPQQDHLIPVEIARQPFAGSEICLRTSGGTEVIFPVGIDLTEIAGFVRQLESRS